MFKVGDKVRRRIDWYEPELGAGELVVVAVRECPKKLGEIKVAGGTTDISNRLWCLADHFESVVKKLPDFIEEIPAIRRLKPGVYNGVSIGCLDQIWTKEMTGPEEIRSAITILSGIADFLEGEKK